MQKDTINCLDFLQKWGGNMTKKSFLIARCNLCKTKGQTAAIVILILAASCMLNLWLMLSSDYKRNFDRYHDKLNAGHVTIALDKCGAELQDFIAKILKEDTRVTQYCIDDILMADASFEYNGGEVSTSCIILEKQAALNRQVERTEIIEESGDKSGIYMPMIYGIDSSIAAGSTIDITIGTTLSSYNICGFLNSVMAGSHNCSMCMLVFSKDKYKELEKKGTAVKSSLISVRINDKTESEDFEAELKNKISSKYPAASSLSNSYNLVSSTRYISQMICAGIVSVAAFLVTLIVIVVIVSNVINYIQKNMKQLGVLKAVGYKSRQIIAALMLQFLGVAITAALAGTGLSYCLFPSINDMMVSQTGIPYKIKFLPLPLIVTVLSLSCVVAFAVWLPSRRIKKIEPIIALRQGIQTHNFKHNYILLEKSHLPLNLALALKMTLSGIKQNITVCITMFVISLVLVFSGLMTENMIADIDPFINMIVGEVADSCININTEIEEEFLQKMDKNNSVSKCYLYHTVELCHDGGIALSATLSDDFQDVNNQSVCFEGRFPKYDNEVAIGAKYAKEKGLKPGDNITLSAESNKAEYIICGLTQVSNYLGKDCLLTRSGYERMGSLQNVSYYINITDGTEIDAFNAKISKEFKNGINNTVNIQLAINGTASIYISLMKIIVIAVLILSAVIITLVLYLLVRTLLNNKKLDYGILKATGFTTGQLIFQTAVSFMPAVAISTVTGLIISSIIINPLVAIFLSGIGIVKCTFVIPAGFTIAAGAGLILSAFGITCLLSIKIRKNTPRLLLTGE